MYYGQGRAGFKISLNSIVNERQNVLVFRDNGPGVSEELQEKIFEEFVSINNSHGTGLGLAYCKRVMRDFGGDIRAELRIFIKFIRKLKNKLEIFVDL